MSTPKPEWVSGEYGMSYDEIVSSWGYQLVDSEAFGDYQGDYAYLLRDGDRHGLVVIGYGSCSGCDALQSVEPWEEDGDWSGVVELADELRKDIHWEDSKAALMAWVSGHPERHWWSYEDEMKKWLNGHGATLPIKETGA